MKWQQRVRVATGLSCWQIMLHLLVVALLVVGWMSKTLVHVGVGLCALYCVTVVMMLVFQRHPEQRWREVADVLEELSNVGMGRVKYPAYDMFGNEHQQFPSVTQRTKALELLGKNYGLFTDKVNMSGVVPVVITGGDELED